MSALYSPASTAVESSATAVPETVVTPACDLVVTCPVSLSINWLSSTLSASLDTSCLVTIEVGSSWILAISSSPESIPALFKFDCATVVLVCVSAYFLSAAWLASYCAFSS